MFALAVGFLAGMDAEAVPGPLASVHEGLCAGPPGPIVEGEHRNHAWARGPMEPGRYWITAGVLLLGLAAASLLPLGRQRLPLWIGASAAAMVALLAVGDLSELRHRLVFGQEVWWLDDDMMITLQYARNLAEGHGLVWNAGERVEGITNFAWSLLLAPLHGVWEDDEVSRGVIVLNSIVLVALILAVARWIRGAGGSWIIAVVGALGVATSTPVLNWTTGGGEAVLVALLLVGLAGRDGRRPLLDGLVAGLVYAVRPDAILVSAILVLGRAGLRCVGGAAGPGGIARCAAGLVVVPAALSLFRRVYYGDFLPNTYYLKATGWDGKTEAGWTYVEPLLIDYAALWAGLLMAVVLVVVARRGEGDATETETKPGPRSALVPVILGVVVHTAYLVRVGGDELVEQRFFVPVLPLLLGASLLGAELLWRRALRPGRKDPGAEPVFAASLAVVGLVAHASFPGELPQRLRGRAEAEFGNVAIGKLLEANTEPDASVAHFWAGAAAYFSNRRGVDLYGKCDPVIARQEARHGNDTPGHNKYDFEHSLGLVPDVVVGGIAGAAGADYVADWRIELPAYRAMADLYDDPRFRQEFGRGLVVIAPESPAAALARKIILEYHGVFVRAGTTEAQPSRAWTVPGSPPPRAPQERP